MKKYMVITLRQDREYVKLKYTDDYSQALLQLVDFSEVGSEMIIARTSDGVILATMTTREETECSD